jgi:hypothetical protein
VLHDVCVIIKTHNLILYAVLICCGNAVWLRSYYGCDLFLEPTSSRP